MFDVSVRVGAKIDDPVITIRKANQRPGMLVIQASMLGELRMILEEAAAIVEFQDPKRMSP